MAWWDKRARAGAEDKNRDPDTDPVELPEREPAKPDAQASQPELSAADASLLSACKSAGIKSGTDISRILQLAKDGEAYGKAADEALMSAAVRFFGATDGKATAEDESFALLSAQRKMDIAAKWNAKADEKFGISETEGASRQTKPGANPQGVNAESSGGGSGKLWDRLTPEQKASGVKWGATTPEKQEAFAKNLLGTEAE